MEIYPSPTVCDFWRTHNKSDLSVKGGVNEEPAFDQRRTGTDAWTILLQKPKFTGENLPVRGLRGNKYRIVLYSVLITRPFTMSSRKIALALPIVFSMVAGFATAGSLTEPVATAVVTPPATAADWSGPFAGVFVGYGDGSYRQQGLGSLGQVVDVDDALAGMRIGHNWQNGGQVFGFDVSLSSGIDGSTPRGTPGNWPCQEGDCNVSIDSLFTLRGRYGGLVAPSTLIYGTAGFASAQIEGGVRNSAQQGSSQAHGYTVGLGIEHKFSDRFSVYGEANYIDLGTLEFGIADAKNRFEGKGDFSTILVGLNYHF
ncbi:outer membrane protein [Pontibaca salina]|uniref:outer membrane protein n=1 Tax=Pontibaca salina TaxID=2795731 RepID=UPI002FCD75AB